MLALEALVTLADLALVPAWVLVLELELEAPEAREAAAAALVAVQLAVA